MQLLTQTRRFWMAALIALTAGGFLPSAAWSQTTDNGPDGLIREVSTSLLEAVKANKGLADGNVDAIKEYMHTYVLPHLNFEGMVAAAVGRPWRDATPEQRMRLQAAYETLLLRSYAGALTRLVGQKLEINPLRAASDDVDVVVKSRLIGDGQPLRIDYRLHKGVDGWKIQDVGVAGIWLNNSYRSQFASVVRKQGLGGLIKLLEKRSKR